jgi:hypothetical protein
MVSPGDDPVRVLLLTFDRDFAPLRVPIQTATIVSPACGVLQIEKRTGVDGHASELFLFLSSNLARTRPCETPAKNEVTDF